MIYVVNWFEIQVIWLSIDLRCNGFMLSNDLRFKWFGCQLIWDSSDLALSSCRTVFFVRLQTVRKHIRPVCLCDFRSSSTPPITSRVWGREARPRILLIFCVPSPRSHQWQLHIHPLPGAVVAACRATYRSSDRRVTCPHGTAVQRKPFAYFMDWGFLRQYKSLTKDCGEIDRMEHGKGQNDLQVLLFEHCFSRVHAFTPSEGRPGLLRLRGRWVQTKLQPLTSKLQSFTISSPLII